MRKASLQIQIILSGAIFALLQLISSAALAQNVCNQQQFEARPIPLGTSGSNINSVGQGFCCGGTLGALVQSTSSRNPNTQYILSNNHVLGRVNHGRAGEPIIQPGLVDQSVACNQNTGDAIARLSQVIPIAFGETGNQADAAIAQIVSGDVSNEILNIGPVSGTIVSSPRAALGLSVQKMGEATCLTTGTVTAINVRGVIQYPAVCNQGHGTATFVNQILVSGAIFANEGDSGALLVTAEPCPRAVGLIFAGSPDGSMTLANPISFILKRLKVQMVAGCTTGASATVSSSASATALEARTAIPAETATAPGIAARPTEAEIREAVAIQVRHHPDMMKMPSVVGTGVGLGGQPGSTAIEVYLSKDTPAARAAIPAQLEGKPVHIVVSGPFVAY